MLANIGIIDLGKRRQTVHCAAQDDDDQLATLALRRRRAGSRRDQRGGGSPTPPARRSDLRFRARLMALPPLELWGHQGDGEALLCAFGARTTA